LNIPFYIAKRYTFSLSKNSAINIITNIASIGIIVGTMCLFVVLSVFSGLKNFSLSFSNDTDPDIRIETKLGKSFLLSEKENQFLTQEKNILHFSKIVEEKALFTFKDKEQIAILKGVDTKYNLVSNFRKKVLEEDWITPNTPEVIVGAGISKKLALGIFDFNNALEVFLPKPGKGLIEDPNEAFNTQRLIPRNIYFVSEEIDEKYIIADIKLAQELLNYQPNQLTFIEIKAKPNVEINVLKENIQKNLSANFVVKNRAELNDALYKMLNTENIAVYLIFTLVVIIALFNLAGALIMMIIEKKQNLKTLHYIGAEISQIKKVFLIQGNIISVVGSIIGIALGTLIIYLQQTYNFIMLTPETPYPVVFDAENIVIVLATILTLGFLTSVLASSRINKKLLE
jgi:lipoprotein-releasing system permease protein